MELIDTHCHFNDPSFLVPTEEAIANAQAVGVGQFVVPGMDLETSETALEICAQYPGVCFPAVGVHPHEVVSEKFNLAATMSELWKLLNQSDQNFQHPSTKSQTNPNHKTQNSKSNYQSSITNYELPATAVAVGEIGIDYHHHDRDETGQRQREVFAGLLEIAMDRNLPAIVHGRDAYGDVLDILKAHPGQRSVLHSFEASYEVAKTVLDLGCLISLTALITYKGNDALREVVAKLPLDRLMFETDAPYLPPQSIRDRLRNDQTPNSKLQTNPKSQGSNSKPVLGARGRNNQPAYMVETAEMLAKLHKTNLKTVATTTTATARQFFGLPTA